MIYQTGQRVIYIDSQAHGTIIPCEQNGPDFCLVLYDGAPNYSIAHPDELRLESDLPTTTLGPPSPFLTKLHGREAQTYYFNDSRAGIAIVAVRSGDGYTNGDGTWAAYIAASRLGTHDEEHAYGVAEANGVKLPRSLAAAMFPDVPAHLWRR